MNQMVRSKFLFLVLGITIVIAIPLLLLTLKGRVQQLPVSTTLLPLPPNHPGVKRVTVSYSLKGKVADIQTTPNETTLLLSLNGRTISFTLSPITRVSRIVNKKPQQVSLSDITTQSTITLIASFDVFEQKWSVVAITIEDESAK